jgi:hypothetical protein
MYVLLQGLLVRQWLLRVEVDPPEGHFSTDDNGGSIELLLKHVTLGAPATFVTDVTEITFSYIMDITDEKIDRHFKGGVEPVLNQINLLGEEIELGGAIMLTVNANPEIAVGMGGLTDRAEAADGVYPLNIAIFGRILDERTLIIALEPLFEGRFTLFYFFILFDIKDPEGVIQIGDIAGKIGMIDAEKPGQKKENDFAFLGGQVLKNILAELIIGEKHLFVLNQCFRQRHGKTPQDRLENRCYLISASY